MRKIAIFLILLIPGAVLGNAGRILYVSGQVTVERDGKTYRAVNRAKIIVGDKILTGSSGRLHLRMSDRTMISLKPNTEFVVETYRFSGENTSPSSQSSAWPLQGAAPQANAKDASAFRLIKGGLRAITGLIGQRDRSAFGVSTPVATIGIRGTSFVASLTEPDSGKAPIAASLPAGLQLASAANHGSTQLDFATETMMASAGEFAPPSAKLTVLVGSGAVVLSNAAGTLILENGEFGQVSGAHQSPERITKPEADDDAIELSSDESLDEAGNPDDESTNVAGRSMSNDDVRTLANDEGQPDQEADDTATTDPINGARREVAFVSRITAEGLPTQVVTLAADGEVIDGSGVVSEFVGVIDRAGRVVPAFYTLDGKITDAGYDPATTLRWGRWSDGRLMLTFADGVVESVDLIDVQLHLISSDAHGPNIVIPTSGSRDFTLIGFTPPTDANGNIGILGDATLRANFDSHSVESAVVLSINNQVWRGSGFGGLGTGLSDGTPDYVFSGRYDNVTVTGAPSAGTGVFSGFLTHEARGAGLAYQLDNGTTAVQGVAAFEGN